MTASPSPEQIPPESGFSTAAAAFLRGLIRLVVILVLGSLLGLGIYFGIPYLYNQFVLPVEQNTTAVEQLQADQTEFMQLMADRLSDMQQRVQSLETNQDGTREILSELQASVEALQADMEAISLQLDSQSKDLSSLESDLAQIQREISSLEQQLDRLVTATSDQQKQLDELELALAENGTPIRRIQSELEILKALQVLTRARLFLGRSDIEQAREELQIARLVLENLMEKSAPDQADFLDRVLLRLDLAARNLVDAPLLAGEDVEISYQLLLGRLVPPPAEVSPAQAEGTPTLPAAGTPAPRTPTPTLLPTRQTASPTATP
jgi:archaellum component FlaC